MADHDSSIGGLRRTTTVVLGGGAVADHDGSIGGLWRTTTVVLGDCGGPRR